MQSNASAIWKGGLKDGNGTFSVASGVLTDTPFTFASRFEGAKGTNPEELIGAAHSSCFSMALSGALGEKKITPESIQTKATVILDKDSSGFAVTESRLVTVVNAPGADKAAVEAAAAGAKENCPISKLLKARISLDLTVNV